MSKIKELKAWINTHRNSGESKEADKLENKLSTIESQENYDYKGQMDEEIER